MFYGLHNYKHFVSYIKFTRICKYALKIGKGKIKSAHMYLQCLFTLMKTFALVPIWLAGMLSHSNDEILELDNVFKYYKSKLTYLNVVII